MTRRIAPLVWLPAWVLGDAVYVTLTSVAGDGSMTYLITPVGRPGAVVVAFDPDGQVLVNGRYVDLGDDLMSLCSLVDENLVGCPDLERELGVAYYSAPFKG